MESRAYSTLEIKEFDDETRTIRGIASTPTPDRGEDTVNPEGVKYTLPLPLLWQHNHGDPIGHVVEAEVTKDGIAVVAEVATGVTEEIDRYWKLIRSGLVRGLSIGFRGLDFDRIPGSFGLDFKEWEWLELSAVTIPMNAEASITSVKQFAARPATETELGAVSLVKNSSVSTEAALGKARVVKMNTPSRVREPFQLLHVKR